MKELKCDTAEIAPYLLLFCSEYLPTSPRDALIHILGKESYLISC